MLDKAMITKHNIYNYTTVPYKFIKFDNDAGSKLLVIRNIRYFAECVVSSKELHYSQIKTVHKAMQEWEKIANVKFIYNENQPKLLISSADLNFFNLDKTKEIFGAGWEINYQKQQVIFIDHKYGYSHQDQSIWLLLHELGHVPFLLEHTSKDLNNIYDNSLSSVMSYNHKLNTDNIEIYPVTPSHLDITLVQQRFGANNFSSQGNDIYTYSLSSKGHYTIYDSDGEDTIDLSNFNKNLVVTLNNGINNINYISSTLSFSIYESSIIENIVTGGGNDIIYGNYANNKINAGSGNNIIYGGLGNDYFIFNKKNPSNNTIKDFRLNNDKIVLENFTVNCSNLNQIIQIYHSHTTINPNFSTSIELIGNYSLLSCNDFIFRESL